MTLEEMQEFFPRIIPRAAAMMIRYLNNVTAATPATGDPDHIRQMAAMLDSPYVKADGLNAPEFDFGISLAVGLTSLYSAAGIPITVLAVFGFALSVVCMIAGLMRGDFCRIPLLLVLTGMGLSGGLYTFAILWFCSWHSLALAYEYLGGVMLIMNVLQGMGVALLVAEIKNWRRKRKKAAVFQTGAD